MTRWFRYYDEALDDPKVQMLPPQLFKAWINLLCLASRNGGALPSLDAIMFALRLDSEEIASTTLSELSKRGLLDSNGETFHPHNWNGRQYKSDDSTDRVKQHRLRKRNGNVSVTANETPPDTEQSTDTDQKTEQKPTIGGQKKRGTRLPEPFHPNLRMAQAEGLSFPQAHREAERFRDYWRAVPGEKGVKLDWDATWRNWCRKAADQLGVQPQEQPEGTMVSRLDPRWSWLALRYERETGKTLRHAEKWPFPEAWLKDANRPEMPNLPVFLDRLTRAS